MTEITMPRLSDQMEEGTIITWLVADGAPVHAGQEIVEIETDKATAPYEAEGDGVLEIVVPEGSTVAVGELIARLVPAAAGVAASRSPGPAARPASANGANAASGANAAGGAHAGIAGVAGVAGAGGERRTPATPLARRLAAAHGIALEDLCGSGPRGRITRGDVRAAAGLDEPAPSASPSAPTRAPGPGGAAPGPSRAAAERGEITRQAMTRAQLLTARRMAEATATVPQFQVQTEAAMDAAVTLRAQLGELEGDESAPSLNDLVVRACALALRRHPLVNGAYVDGGFELYRRINVGIAVAADDGLLVVTIHDADIRSLGEIGRASRRLAERVRAGTVAPAELSGATFTISNLGMYGMTAITPVINPPQAAILGVGAVREVLAREGGEIVDRRVMTLTLSGDHRILDGATAARFLSDVCALLESPLRLAL